MKSLEFEGFRGNGELKQWVNCNKYWIRENIADVWHNNFLPDSPDDWSPPIIWIFLLCWCSELLMATILILDFNGFVSLMPCVAHSFWIIEQFFFGASLNALAVPPLLRHYRTHAVSWCDYFLCPLFGWQLTSSGFIKVPDGSQNLKLHFISFCWIWKFFCVRRVTSPPYGWVGGNSGGRVRITFEITNFTNNPISVISYYHLHCQFTNFTKST